MVEMTVHGTTVAGDRDIRTIHVAGHIDQLGATRPVLFGARRRR
jgi:hypothetical protein